MATLEQVESALLKADAAGDADAARILAAEVRRMRSAKTSPVTGGRPLTSAAQPEPSASLGDRVGNLWSGIKNAVAAPLVGGAQRLGLEGAQNTADAWAEDAAAIGKRPGGLGGQVLGGTALVAPTAMLPGANTIAGGAFLGGLTGSLQPTAEGESALWNTALGAGMGAAVPAGIRAAKTAKALAVDPFTEAGKTRIAGKTIYRASGEGRSSGILPRNAAGNDVEQYGAYGSNAPRVLGDGYGPYAGGESLVERLSGARGNTPGFQPSTAQAARNDGISTLDRTVRAMYPADYGPLDQEQRYALASALKSVAQTPEARKTALDAANASAKSLYGPALKEQMPVTDALVKLAQRPSMRRAEARAESLGEEIGAPFQAYLKDLRPQYIPIGKQKMPPAEVIVPQSSQERYMMHPETEKVIPMPDGPTQYFEVPPVESMPVRDMHTIKMGMDALMQDPTIGIAGREKAAINATRNRFLDLFPESYQRARLSHIEMNRPVHQMDIGQELYKRFVPALADQGSAPFRNTANTYATALREGDTLAQNVTGMKNAKLDKIMTPEQMVLLQGISKDAESKAASEVAGRGAGSDTVQKLAMANLAAEAGIPTFVQNFASVPGGWIKRGADVLYKSADEDIRKKLAFLLTNPQEAAAAMRGAVPWQQSQLGQFLLQATQGATLAAPTAYTAIARE